MNNITMRLDYSTVRDKYREKFGNQPPGTLLKSVSLMDGGTQDLARALKDAIESGTPLDFNTFAKRFFEHLAGPQTARQSISPEPAIA